MMSYSVRVSATSVFRPAALEQNARRDIVKAMMGTRGRFRFRKSRKLRRRKDFGRVFAARRTVSNDLLIVHIAANHCQTTRLGIVVGRRYGSAVQRNRFKRLVREAFRLGGTWPDGYDLVVRPRKSFEQLTLEAVSRALAELVPAAVRKAQRR
jgi:ribonuclease P protein component